jgi:hypothetical protein
MIQSVSASIWPDSSASANEHGRADGAVLRMHPACEGLETAEPIGLELVDRLEVHAQLSLADGAPQVGFQREFFGHLAVHGAVEAHDTAAASRLGLVHRQIDVAHDLVGRSVAEVAEGDADAHARGDLGALQVCRTAQFTEHTIGQLLGDLRVVRRLDQGREFVAAQARHQVEGAHTGAQPGRHFTQQLRCRRHGPGCR